jgi:hypothetical protein
MTKQFFKIYTVCALLTLAACSSPRYTYNFDYYDYNSGRKKEVKEPNEVEPTEPLKLDPNNLVASTTPSAAASSEKEISTPLKSTSLHETAGGYRTLSKTERKQMRKELKSYIMNYSKALRSGDEGARVEATKQLDDDLKLAIIFGAIGVTLAILGGINTVFWVLGVIGLVVGLVFFIHWISRQ